LRQRYFKRVTSQRLTPRFSHLPLRFGFDDTEMKQFMNATKSFSGFNENVRK
jgi:hypothetical protein